MEEMKENPICLFCNELTTSDLRITEDINSVIVGMFDRENIPLFHFYLCSECHTRVTEAKGILALLDQLQSRLQVITTNLRNLMSETETITSNTTEARFQLLNSTLQIVGDPEILNEPLSLEEEAFCNDNDDNCYELETQESDSKPSLADIQGLDSNFTENDESNLVSDFDPFSDIENHLNTKQFRSQQFSEEESRVLWKEYLRQRRKSKNGIVSGRKWKKIARIVSKVNNVTRTPIYCQYKNHNLKAMLKKAAGKTDRKSNIPVWLEEEQKSDEDGRQTSESESEPEETDTEHSKISSAKASQFRSRQFSDEESRMLWKEYLRQLRKSKNGIVSGRKWKKIARVVSKVNNVTRTPIQCQDKRHNLKAMLKSAAGKSDKGSNIPVWLKFEEENNKSDEDGRQTIESDSSESEPEETDAEDSTRNSVKTRQVRSRPFSDEESRVLWREYLRQRRKSKNGTLSIQIWAKIARIVSKVDKVTRTHIHCQDKIHNLKATFRKADGKSDRENIPIWLNYEEEEKNSSQSESEPEEIFDASNLDKDSINHFSNSEIRILWDEYMKRKSEIKRATRNTATRIWTQIAVILSSRCKTIYTSLQCRRKVENLLYEERYLNYGLPESDHHLDNKVAPKILPPPSVYTIHTQNGPVELKTAVLELPKCDLVQQYKSSRSTPPNARIKKLRECSLRRKEALRETLKLKEQFSTAEKRSTSDVSYECSNCLKKFSNQVKLKLHAKTHQVRHNCINTTCTLSFRKIVELESHIKHQHTEIERGHTCETRGCWRNFFTEEGLKYHHERSHDESTKNFVCEVCAMKFFTLTKLKNHCKVTHNAQLYTCKYCKKVYKTKAKFHGHQAQMHGSMDPEKFKPELQTCNICGYIAHSRKYLDRHMKRHTKDFKFYCSVPGCNFGSFTMSSLKIHLHKHDPTPQHQCQFCPAKFRFKGGLQHHMQAHTGIKKYKCKPCGKEFAHHTSWKNHNEIHHMPPEIRYMCNKCGDGFTACKNYQNHRKKCG